MRWALILAAIALTSPAIAGDVSRSFYDRNGSFAGSSTTYNQGRNTSSYDRNGHFEGTTIRNQYGRESYYDRNGHFQGSTITTRR
jgi:hypothetical protein